MRRWRFDLRALNEEACGLGHAEWCETYKAYFFSIYAKVERRKRRARL